MRLELPHVDIACPLGPDGRGFAVTRINDRLVGELFQFVKRLLQLPRIATRKIRSSAGAPKKRVAGNQDAGPWKQQTAGAGGVPRCFYALELEAAKLPFPLLFQSKKMISIRPSRD